jgi:hypothetical protein
MKRSPMPIGASTRQRLDDLAPLAAELNDATDAITERLKAIEGEMDRLAIGLDVRVDAPLVSREMDSDEAARVPVLEEEFEGVEGPPADAPVVESSYLAYGRHSDRWRLLVRRCLERKGRDDEWVLITSRDFPLVSASRDLRLAAWEQIDDLLEEIANRTKRKLRSLDVANSPSKPLIPPGWEKHHVGVDEVGMAHVLSKELTSGVALCGAQIVSTNLMWDEETQTCPMCARLEHEFDDAMMSIYQRAKAESGYTATRYLQMLSEHGGLETARILLHASKVSEGYVALWERKRLDLTVEALILDNVKFHPLFTTADLDIARKRLAQYEYGPAMTATGHTGFHRAVDEAGLLHLLKRNTASGETLCGARAVSTNVPEGSRPCPKCRALARAGGK